MEKEQVAFLQGKRQFSGIDSQESGEMVSLEIKRIKPAEIRLIQVVEERLILKINDYLKGTKWIATCKVSFGAIIGIIPVLITSDFKDFILPAKTWQIIYLLGLVVFSLSFIISGIFSLIMRKKLSVKNLISEIEGNCT